MNTVTGLAEPDVTIDGIDPSRLRFGEIKDLDGKVIDLASLDACGCDQRKGRRQARCECRRRIHHLLQQSADQLKSPAIADSLLTGAVDLEQPGMVMSLERLQELTGQTDSTAWF